MLTLNLPTRNDPLSKILLFLMLAAALWANVAQIETPTAAQAADPGYTIIDATPTPALPTLGPDAPALGLIAPTPTPAPGWLDQGLAAAAAAGDQFAQSQADQLAAEQAAAQAAADQAQYLANVGAQAPHSPRGDAPAQPPAYSTGPVAQPVNADNEIIAIDPNPAPAPAGLAAAVPRIGAEQAAIIGARESNGCAAGETFYPRTGCHAIGSGGPQPGAVGETQP